MNPKDSASPEPERQKTLPRNPFAGDYGDLLPKTAHALRLAWAGEVGEAQVALVQALQNERLILPAPLPAASPRKPEVTPDILPGPEALDNCASQTLRRGETPWGEATLAFSSAKALAEFEAGARPVLMSAQRVALDALTGPARLVVDLGVAGSIASSPVVLGRPALVALASGDDWLSPWEDAELEEIILTCCREAGFAHVRIQPQNGAGLALQIKVGDKTMELSKRIDALGRALAAHPEIPARAAFVQIQPCR